MGTWSTRGLRGSVLEDLINMTNEQYKQKKLALIQKIPTPITPVQIEQSTRHITLAYFDSKSTVDYIGVVQGIPICFDAKECATDTFPISNIHRHQVEFMECFEEQEGISFIIIHYSSRKETYYLPFIKIKEFYNRSVNGGRKSFKIDEINKSYKIGQAPGIPVHYLEMIQRDLSSRKE